MTQKEHEMLMQYFYNNLCFLENDVQQLRQNFHYRKVDAVDCIEFALALERLNAFKDFSSDVCHLLKIVKKSKS